MRKRLKRERETSSKTLLVLALAGALLATGCSGTGEDRGGPPGKGGRGAPGEKGRRSGGGRDEAASVPVEVAAVERGAVSSYLETNGTLEAENDVDIVARTQGPILELAVEEGMRVRKGQLLLRIDDTELRAQVEIAKVELEDAKRAHERAKAARESEIISQEVYDTALAGLESAEARLYGAQVLLDYARVTAPFDGVVVERYVKLAETVTPNQPLFRISDFDPLLCKIQVPEKELSRLEKGQTAFLNVEAWPERFEAKVLRISPVVDAATGTIRVTLEVHTRGKLSPGMFASVFLVTDTHENTLVMPKRALSLESLSDTVFVAANGRAERRAIELGYEESDVVEVLVGLEEGERVIVVGQDGLTDGTPVQVLKGPGAREPGGARADSFEGPPPGRGADFEGRGGEGGARPDFSSLTPEQLERIKKRMRDRGMSEEEIEEAIRRRSSRQ